MGLFPTSIQLSAGVCSYIWRVVERLFRIDIVDECDIDMLCRSVRDFRSNTVIGQLLQLCDVHDVWVLQHVCVRPRFDECELLFHVPDEVANGHADS